jgi:hypothetical protein
MRVVLLNGLPLSIIPYRQFTLEVSRIDVNQLAEMIASSTEVRNYIRHPATVDVLNALLKTNLRPSAENYAYNESDTIVVITVKNVVRGQEMNVKPEDLDMFVVRVHH